MSHEQQPDSQQMSPHVLTVFKALFDELKFIKQQQWTITNYAVLLLAAIATFSLKNLDVAHFHSKLKFVAVLTAAIASTLLILIQWDMMRARMRLDKLQKSYFTQQELADIGPTKQERQSLNKETCSNQCAIFRRGWEFLITLFAVLWGGVFLVVYSL
jgi:hypothetical protein